MKFLLLIPDGVGIRNFLCTAFMDHLLSKGSVMVWHALPEESLKPFQERWKGSVFWKRLPPFQEKAWGRFFRLSKVYTQLYSNYEPTTSDILIGFLRPSGNWKNKILGHTAHFLGKSLKTRKRFLWLHEMHQWVIQQKKDFTYFETFLKNEKPDIIFCTHQRSSVAMPAMVAARKLKIPTTTFIYSWDNLPKGGLILPSDYFLVWSEFMKQELQFYYPEIKSEQIRVVGTPQFEPYFHSETIESKEVFHKRLGLDVSRPSICFSGDDISTSPHDPIYLSDLAFALRQIPEKSRPQVLFRRCPADWSSRYDWVLKKYPEIKVSDPYWKMYPGDWTQIIPTLEDVSLLTNVVHHCDLVINMASTMAMDFSILNKPAIYVNYNPPGINLTRWNAHDMYRLPHFHFVHELQPVHWVNQPQDLSVAILSTLKNPNEKAEARRSWLKVQVQQPLDQASLRCASTLQSLL